MKLIIGKKTKISHNLAIGSIRDAIRCLEEMELKGDYALVIDGNQKHPIAQFLRSSMDGQWYRTYMKRSKI